MVITLMVAVLVAVSVVPAMGQKITDAGYKTVAYIKSDGTVQDSGYKTIGHIKSDGTVQDAGYRTIGHAKDIPNRWAALYFFFRF